MIPLWLLDIVVQQDGSGQRIIIDGSMVVEQNASGNFVSNAAGNVVQSSTSVIETMPLWFKVLGILCFIVFTVLIVYNSGYFEDEEESEAHVKKATPEEILAHKLADGVLTPEEYTERMARL